MFDVYDTAADITARRTDKYIRWKSEYGQVYKKFVGRYLQDPPSQPVKIAVLDTGIDRDHFVFEAREENLKGKKNCYNESQKNVPDTHGHGTFTANLILDYAPDASLYVIKIADKGNTRPDAKIVANVSRNKLPLNFVTMLITIHTGHQSCYR